MVKTTYSRRAALSLTSAFAGLGHAKASSSVVESLAADYSAYLETSKLFCSYIDLRELDKAMDLVLSSVDLPETLNTIVSDKSEISKIFSDFIIHSTNFRQCIFSYYPEVVEENYIIMNLNISLTSIRSFDDLNGGPRPSCVYHAIDVYRNGDHSSILAKSAKVLSASPYPW